MHPKAIGLMFALAVAGSATQAAPALAGLAGEQTDRVRLALGTMPVGGGATPAIVVHGANGRYDRVATTSVALPLTLYRFHVMSPSALTAQHTHCGQRTERRRHAGGPCLSGRARPRCPSRGSVPSRRRRSRDGLTSLVRVPAGAVFGHAVSRTSRTRPERRRRRLAPARALRRPGTVRRHPAHGHGRRY